MIMHEYGRDGAEPLRGHRDGCHRTGVSSDAGRARARDVRASVAPREASGFVGGGLAEVRGRWIYYVEVNEED